MCRIKRHFRVRGRGVGGRARGAAGAGGGARGEGRGAPLPVNRELRRQPRGCPGSVPGGGRGSSQAPPRRGEGAPHWGVLAPDPARRFWAGDRLRSPLKSAGRAQPVGSRGNSKHSGAPTAACDAAWGAARVAGVGSSGPAMGSGWRVGGRLVHPEAAAGNQGRSVGGSPLRWTSALTATTLGGSSFSLMK